jgi:hypothetical protein
MIASEHLSSFWLPGLAAILVVLVMVILVIRRKGVRLHGMQRPEFRRIIQHPATPGATQILITGDQDIAIGLHLAEDRDI